jgi:hypothetical protein
MSDDLLADLERHTTVQRPGHPSSYCPRCRSRDDAPCDASRAAAEIRRLRAELADGHRGCTEKLREATAMLDRGAEAIQSAQAERDALARAMRNVREICAAGPSAVAAFVARTAKPGTVDTPERIAALLADVEAALAEAPDAR